MRVKLDGAHSSQSTCTLERDSTSAAPFEPPAGSMENLVELDGEFWNPHSDEHFLFRWTTHLSLAMLMKFVLEVSYLEEDVGDALTIVTTSEESLTCAHECPSSNTSFILAAGVGSSIGDEDCNEVDVDPSQLGV